MLCDHCKKNVATAHVTQTVNEKTTQMHLCGDCAAKQGFGNTFSNFGFDFGDFWGSLFAEPAKRIQDDAIRCADCGRSFREVAQWGKPGCPTCYVTFYDRLLPSIQRIHGKTQHTGKALERAMEVPTVEQEIAALKKELESCLQRQDYEQCATLRDRIRELEGKGEEQ